MSRYYNNNQKSRRERIGFYTALTICLIAICMAVYSTYSSVIGERREERGACLERGDGRDGDRAADARDFSHADVGGELYRSAGDRAAC